jgi:signal transduction histidine kinase
VDRIAKTHGGNLVLSNRPEAGLAVTVTIQVALAGNPE